MEIRKSEQVTISECFVDKYGEKLKLKPLLKERVKVMIFV